MPCNREVIQCNKRNLMVICMAHVNVDGYLDEPYVERVDLIHASFK